MSNWKLVSPAKVAANHANAKLSTGPKTDEGKGPQRPQRRQARPVEH